MIQLTENYVFWDFHPSVAYAGIKLAGLPKTITVEGVNLLLKTEFHITLINLEDCAKLIDGKGDEKLQAELLTVTKDYLRDHKLDEFKLSSEFRFVQRDIRKSVIVMCQLPGGEEFFAMLRGKYKTNLPLQPFHITLYAFRPNRGIGLLSDEEIEQYSVPVTLTELRDIKQA